MKRIVPFLFFIIFVSTIASAQIDFGSLEDEQIYRPDRKYNTWSLTAGYGSVIYYTDVIDYTFFPSSNMKFGPSVQLAKQLGRAWSVEAEFLMADMYEIGRAHV